MEENQKITATGGSLISEDKDVSTDGYVSPEVLAAMNGERVEFGHDLNDGSEDDTDSR